MLAYTPVVVRRTIPCPVALVVVVLLLGPGCARPSAPAPAAPAATSEPTASLTPDPNDPLASLAWLAGTWVSDDSESPHTVEHWLVPEGGSMLGVNRAAQGGRTVFFEYLRIEAQPEGIAYLASPRGKAPPTRFAAVASSSGFIAFENLEHDFPQRIEYRREGDRLHMQVSGMVDGATKAETWSMRRVGG